jgi:hypothetical protein
MLYAAPPAAPRDIDARRLSAAGVRALEGRYVRVLTDLPSSTAVDELPALFDAAVPKWAAYFGMKEGDVRGRWLAFVVHDRERFAALGLMPEEKPDFPNGFARDYEFWLVEQPSDYYRRHLFLHEGTHAFMQSQLGGAGAPWYMEGIAEFLGTHIWRDGRLELGVMPASRDDFPMWGRIKIIRDAALADKVWSLEQILAIDNRRGLSTEYYAWTWALAIMLEKHPKFQEPFHGLREHIINKSETEITFNDFFKLSYHHVWGLLHNEWLAFTAELDYGYDIPRMAIEFVGAEALHRGDLNTAFIDANRGWQTTDWLLHAGKNYRITARGSYQIARDEKPWMSEPGGVTIEYHNGRPLGALLGALDRAPKGQTPNPSFARPMSIGLEATLRPEHDAVLFLRVNESGANMDDNAGQLEVRLEPMDESKTQLGPDQ